MITKLAAIVAVIAFTAQNCAGQAAPAEPGVSGTLTISLRQYPNVGDHARDAMAAGESKVCTIDRDGADDRRKDALRGHRTAPGKDRDEFPPAVCKEGGRGADVRLVPSAENRSQGAWMSGQLRKWPDGTRILIAVSR